MSRKLIGKLLNGIAKSVFPAITGKAQQREHHTLVVGDRHFLTLREDYVRKRWATAAFSPVGVPPLKAWPSQRPVSGPSPDQFPNQSRSPIHEPLAIQVPRAACARAYHESRST